MIFDFFASYSKKYTFIIDIKYYNNYNWTTKISLEIRYLYGKIDFW